MVKSKNKYVNRQLEKKLVSLAKTFPAVALCGPRQSGKSTILAHLFQRTHKLISFDDPVNRERAASDPRILLERAGENILLDEIQYAPQILSYIKILIDEDREKRGRFIITGSQQFNLIKNLGDTLAGRIAIVDLLPFSMAEKIRPTKLRKASDFFIHAGLRGSFPELVIHPEIDADAWYGSYLQTYLERDVRTLYNVGKLREFQQFLRLLAARCSQSVNLSSYSRELGISINTIKKWFSILEAGRVIYLLSPYYRNLGKRITKNPKVYFLDIGLVCYLTGIRDAEHLLNGPLAGSLFENFVIQETVKEFYNRGARPNIYYLRTHNNLEVDLIVESNLELYPYEIKMTKTPKLRMADNIERFRGLFSKLSVKKGRLITLGEDELPLTRNVDALGIRLYLDSLRQFI